MPLVLLTVRLMIDVIMQRTYPMFYGNISASGANQQDADGDPETEAHHIMQARRLINGVLTDLLDPNLFFSRISFLESGKEALDIKSELKLGKRVGFA